MGCNQVAAYLGLSVQTIYGLVFRNKMPKPDQMLGASRLWRRSTIDRWQQERKS